MNDDLKKLIEEKGLENVKLDEHLLFDPEKLFFHYENYKED